MIHSDGAPPAVPNFSQSEVNQYRIDNNLTEALLTALALDISRNTYNRIGNPANNADFISNARTTILNSIPFVRPDINMANILQAFGITRQRRPLVINE